MNQLGNWITNGTNRPFYARKELNIDKPIRLATALVCGLGQFVFYVNGQKAGDHELDPGWTDYRKYIEYVKFDISNLLRQGKNVLGAEVGNGWYIMDTEGGYSFHFPPFMPENPNPYKPFGRELVFAMKLTLEYEDGTSEEFTADTSWQTAPHEILHSNVYGSEIVELSRMQEDFTDPNTVEISHVVSDAISAAASDAISATVSDDTSDAISAAASDCASDTTLDPVSDATSGDASDWSPALISHDMIPETVNMVEQFQPPVKVIRRYPAADTATRKSLDAINLCPDQACICDFGQNMSGLLEFDVRGKKGTVIRFSPAEKLTEDGDADQMAKNWMLIDTKITVTIGKEQEWQHFRQKFTYFAGRYMRVEIIVPEEESKQSLNPKAAGKQITAPESDSESAPVICELRNLTANAITSAWKDSGSFISDDERYNQIYDLVKKAVEANMVSVHTDCPTIERFAWQEPNHLMGGAILFMKDGRKLWEKFLKDMREGQHTAEDFFHDLDGRPFYPGDGLIPSQCPCYIPNVLPVPGMGSFYDIIPWGSALILGTGWHYLFYGDLQIIRDNYPAGVRYLNHLKTKLTEEGFISHGLGDWGNPEGEYARENIETAFLYADAGKLAEFAELLGLPEEAAGHRAFAEEIRDNYNSRLLVQDENGRWVYRSCERRPAIVTTQACEALPLYFGMVPDDKKSDVEEAFRQALISRNAFVSGEVGLPYIIQTARRLGMNDLIADYITRPEHPSYYAFVRDGLTTLGEYWENNPRSQCHDMMGHIIEWYYNGIAGIEILEPGFKKIAIHPYMPAGMTHFLCTYQTPQGEIRIECRKTLGTCFSVSTSVPDGIEVQIEEQS